MNARKLSKLFDVPGMQREGVVMNARRSHHMHPAVMYASGFFTGVVVVAIAWAVFG